MCARIRVAQLHTKSNAACAVVFSSQAFIIEHGFWTTDIGREHYFMNLRQITDAIHQTAHLGVMEALLGCFSERVMWKKRHGAVTLETIDELLQDERWTWGCVQKDIKGLYILDAELKDRLRRDAGVTPNAWVWPSKMSLYAAMTPEYTQQYQQSGERALQAGGALAEGDKYYATFRGTPVYEVRIMLVDQGRCGSCTDCSLSPPFLSSLSSVQTHEFDIDFAGVGIDPLKVRARVTQQLDARLACSLAPLFSLCSDRAKSASTT